jgi:ParB family chromosome partitioning protein
VLVQSFLRTGRISVGHAKVVLGLADEKTQQAAAERIVKEGLNVRQTEGLVAKLQSRGAKISGDHAKTSAIVPVDSNIGRLEEKLRVKFGTKVHLKYAKGRGAVEISFFSDDELQRVLEILNVTAD